MNVKIALAGLSVILVASLLVEALRPTTSVADRPKRTMPYVVLIVLDGARPDYFSVPGIPHVQELLRNGAQYSNAWAGILESETPSGHAALTTGTEPHRNGILSFAWADSDNTSINLFNPEKIRAGDQREIMRRAGVPTIAGLVHARDRDAKVVALGGHKYYAHDALGGPDADVIAYYTGMADGTFAPVGVPGHMPPTGILSAPGLAVGTTKLPVGVEDHLAMKLATTTFQRMRQQVTMINLPEFDWPLGHVLGGSRDPATVRKLMHGFDRDLAALQEAYREAGVLDQTLFVLTADHGTAAVYRTVDKADITAAVTTAGTRIISDTYHTGAYLWVQDKHRAASAAANIAHLRNPNIGAVYFKERTPAGTHYIRATGADLFHAPAVEPANQYLLRTFNGPNGPDIVVFFRQGAASLPGGQASWKGDHGGADWESQHMPLIFSGPGVRRAYVSPFPARLVDIAPTTLAIMGITDTGMDGAILADSMEKPSSAVRGAQTRKGADLEPVVSALKAQSRSDLAEGPQ